MSLVMLKIFDNFKKELELKIFNRKDLDYRIIKKEKTEETAKICFHRNKKLISKR